MRTARVTEFALLIFSAALASQVGPTAVPAAPPAAGDGPGVS